MFYKRAKSDGPT